MNTIKYDLDKARQISRRTASMMIREDTLSIGEGVISFKVYCSRCRCPLSIEDERCPNCKSKLEGICDYKR